MTRTIGLTLLVMAWVAVVWGVLDDRAQIRWFGTSRSVAYLAAPLLAASIWLLLRSAREREEPD